MASTDAGADAPAALGTDPESGTDTDGDDTLDLHLPEEFVALFREPPAGSRPDPGAGDDLLDRVADWGPTATSAGLFRLVPVRADRDVALIGRWMNDPAVAAFWELTGPQSVTEDHLRAQLAGDGRSVPCLGLLDGTPMSYWEIYRADLDPLARYCPVRPHDTGIHLLIGDAADRGRGLGTTLIRAVADLVLARRTGCTRVLAEPDVRNTPSVAAFLKAGFRLAAEVELPAKRAALMVRDRCARELS
ncbi:GNAT family N-acetyltransferase [Streptomyces sp. JHA26]|uniref:GNAT family N-acetyltransferase n=1 Tax=Streptomyces sp. JHA26 TaxID=1917143 RepID=UPI00098B145C|nr:GNAT family N-acetyltransferase [Streptomyces sp. JHA26]